MRRLAVMLGLLLVGLPGISWALDRQGMAVVGAGGGAGFLGGAPSLYNDAGSSDPRTRLSVRAHTRYLLDNHWSVTGSLGYIWNSYLGSYDPGTKQTQDTLLAVTPIEVGVMYSFGADYRAHRPYVGAQLGLYRWEFISNMPFGVRQVVRDVPDAVDLDHTFFGYGLTVGHEFLWRDNTGVFLELDWRHVGSGNLDGIPASSPYRRFLGSLNVTELRLGFNYYFSVTGGARRAAAPAPGAAAARPDTTKAAPLVKGTLKPEVQKENIQIVPEAAETPSSTGTKPAAAPAAPPAPSSVPPLPPAQPAAPDTTAGKK